MFVQLRTRSIDNERDKNASGLPDSTDPPTCYASAYVCDFVASINTVNIPHQHASGSTHTTHHYKLPLAWPSHSLGFCNLYNARALYILHNKESVCSASACPPHPYPQATMDFVRVACGCRNLQQIAYEHIDASASFSKTPQTSLSIHNTCNFQFHTHRTHTNLFRHHCRRCGCFVQVERKRHIGNDIVNVVFVDGDIDDADFQPTCIKSQFTRILFIVSACACAFWGVRVDIRPRGPF